MTVNLTNIGETIRMIRFSKGIKQKDLQKNLVHSCNLSKIERNVSQISLATFLEILELLNVTTEEFFLLHSLNTEVITSLHDSVNNHLRNNYPRITIKHLERHIKQLTLHGNASFDDLSSNKEKILFHRLVCFYYLNFKKNRDGARFHANILLDYYKNIIHQPLLAELEILPILMPFLSITEGKNFLEDFQFFHKLHPNNYHAIQKIYIRAQLNFAKRCLEENDELYFGETIEHLSFELMNYPIPSFYCEFLILKGILFYDIEKQKDAGISLINKGLSLAKEFHFFNIYDGWKEYCSPYINGTK